MKRVQARLSPREDRESSFHRYGGRVRLMQACLCAGNPDKPPRVCYDVREVRFMCQGKSRKQFSLLWRSCEARKSMSKCGKDLITPF